MLGLCAVQEPPSPQQVPLEVAFLIHCFFSSQKASLPLSVFNICPFDRRLTGSLL